MSKKLVLLCVVTCVLSLAALGVAGMAWFQVWLNQPLAKAAIAEEPAIAAVAGVKAEAGDLALDLRSLDEGGNSQVLWHCGKVLAGARYDYAAAWTHLVGKVLLDPKSRTLRAGELHVTVGAMRGAGEHPAPNALINTVRENQWFLEQEHPIAVFKGSTITPRRADEPAPFDKAVGGWTHLLSGTLSLNGIEKLLAIAAEVEVGEGSVRIDAAFPVSRQEFGIAKRQGFEPPADVDDEVVIEVHVHASRDPLDVVVDLQHQLVTQQAATGLLQDRIDNLTVRLERAESALELMRRDIKAGAGGVNPPAAIDIGKLPARFADHVDYHNSSGDTNYKDLGYAPEFEMVLVKGDPEAGIAPFYVQTTEVTWQMFRAWSYCEDVAVDSEIAALRAADLRPSPCHDDASRGFGYEGRAALGLSRRNALAFCRYLSERTGRSYRLMTGAEWNYLARAAGGLPAIPQEVAWLRNNADTDLFGDPIPMPVATRPANSLGLYDFWGNVAEWVMDDDQYIRGGSYLTDSKDLSLEWREKESQDIWNATYPNTPKSKWWYRDRFDMGFRLVCDPVNLPAGK